MVKNGNIIDRRAYGTPLNGRKVLFMTLVLNLNVVVNITLTVTIILTITASLMFYYEKKCKKHTKDKTAKRRKPTKDKKYKLKVRNP